MIIKNSRQKYLETTRMADKKYQAKKRKLGLVNKTDEYRLWKEKNPGAAKSHMKVYRAIKKGKIKRGKCLICKKESTEKNINYAHHKDYNKPFIILWLCPSCHKKYHLGLVEV